LAVLKTLLDVFIHLIAKPSAWRPGRRSYPTLQKGVSERTVQLSPSELACNQFTCPSVRMSLHQPAVASPKNFETHAWWLPAADRETTPTFFWAMFYFPSQHQVSCSDLASGTQIPPHSASEGLLLHCLLWIVVSCSVDMIGLIVSSTKFTGPVVFCCEVPFQSNMHPPCVRLFFIWIHCWRKASRMGKKMMEFNFPTKGGMCFKQLIQQRKIAIGWAREIETATPFYFCWFEGFAFKL
jgi:hypothetical protein